MKIGFDARCLEEEKISGVGEYALEILRHLLENDSANQYVIFSNSYKQKSGNFDFFDKYPNVELKRFRFPNKLLNFCLWYFGRPKLDKMTGGCDVFFAPNINFLTASKNCRLVTTFHDLSFERFPGFFTRKTRLWHFFFVNPRRIAKLSSSIIAVSESTKRDLEEIYGIDAEKIKVVPHGVSSDFRVIDRNNPKLLGIQKKYDLPHKFVLYLGNVEPRKNIHSIIKAFKSIEKRSKKLGKYNLVLAGNVSPLCRGEIEREKENVRAIGYIDREDKPFVFNLASLFIYPSFFEGFGLPILEAMACGTPVIASNNSSIPEVAGSAAIFVDPNRPDELREAMTAVLSDEKLYDKMKDRGLKRAEKFSWKKSAEKTQEILTNQRTN